MQGWDQNLIKIWKYNLMGLPEGWVEKVRTKEFGDKIGLGFGDTRRVWIWGDGGMAGWSDDISSHSLPATLPSTAKTSTRFPSDYQDQEILRNDISSLDNVPHLVQVWKLLFLEHTSCIWCCMYCYESLISSKWIGNHGYETPLSSMIRDIIMSSWIILWPLFQCCPGLPQTYYLSLIICLSVSSRATFC